MNRRKPTKKKRKTSAESATIKRQRTDEEPEVECPSCSHFFVEGEHFEACYYVLLREREHRQHSERVEHPYAVGHITTEHRLQVVHWMWEIAVQIFLPREVLHHAVAILDKYMAARSLQMSTRDLPLCEFQILACACINLAADAKDISFTESETTTVMGADADSVVCQQFRELVLDVAVTVNFDHVYMVTPVTWAIFLWDCISRFAPSGSPLRQHLAREEVWHRAMYLLDMSLLLQPATHRSCLNTHAVAAAAFYVSVDELRKAGQEDFEDRHCPELQLLWNPRSSSVKECILAWIPLHTLVTLVCEYQQPHDYFPTWVKLFRTIAPASVSNPVATAREAYCKAFEDNYNGASHSLICTGVRDSETTETERHKARTAEFDEDHRDLVLYWNPEAARHLPLQAPSPPDPVPPTS